MLEQKAGLEADTDFRYHLLRVLTEIRLELKGLNETLVEVKDAMYEEEEEE